MDVPPQPSSLSTRDTLLVEAEAMAALMPWHEVTMAKLGRACGVSRQTVYNEFGTKEGLAQAIALRVTSRVLDDVLAALESSADIEDAIAAGLTAAFAHADGAPLVTAVLTGQSGPDGLLRVVTTDAMPMLTMAGSVLTEAVLDRWPTLDPALTARLADAAVRLVISHLLQPGPPREHVAAQIAWMFSVAAEVGTSHASGQPA